MQNTFKCKYLLKERAGIGIYIDWEKDDHKAIYIQAASFANSALQAEVQALEIAAHIGKSLNIHNPIFLTDNLILVQAIPKKDPANYRGHWIIRPNLY
jgi:ribonuclease HI